MSISTTLASTLQSATDRIPTEPQTLPPLPYEERLQALQAKLDEGNPQNKVLVPYGFWGMVNDGLGYLARHILDPKIAAGLQEFPLHLPLVSARREKVQAKVDRMYTDASRRLTLGESLKAQLKYTAFAATGGAALGILGGYLLLPHAPALQYILSHYTGDVALCIRGPYEAGRFYAQILPMLPFVGNDLIKAGAWAFKAGRNWLAPTDTQIATQPVEEDDALTDRAVTDEVPKEEVAASNLATPKESWNRVKNFVGKSKVIPGQFHSSMKTFLPPTALFGSMLLVNGVTMADAEAILAHDPRLYFFLKAYYISKAIQIGFFGYAAARPFAWVLASKKDNFNKPQGPTTSGPKRVGPTEQKNPSLIPPQSLRVAHSPVAQLERHLFVRPVTRTLSSLHAWVRTGSERFSTHVSGFNRSISRFASTARESLMTRRVI